MPSVTGFANSTSRQRHFRDHGSDFAAIDASDYEAKAKAFLEKPLGGSIEEAERASDKYIVRFDRSSNEFAIASPSGVICTYYYPTPRHLAPPSKPKRQTHRFATNLEYYEDVIKK